ncbi:amidase [Actimicrobium sp. CCI2.3]|uniref:amidase n=1 Tax=Actimicrobium sp. CCI2.3 TaxID=3048616 RepID=UPI002AB3C614|nr:amidase [Actimicrobium sp. CCI2.3]MDY7573049.1 amidase [Actimicrobium sp. CCI2.3]
MRQSLVDYVDWLGYGHGERVEAWIERLGMNMPELQHFRAQTTPSCPAYVASPAAMPVADGVPDRVLAIKVTPDQEILDAMDRAKELAHWNMFTWLAAEIPQREPGFLGGMLVAIKDLMTIADRPLSGGSAALNDTIALRDAEVVARLRRAGAAFIGATNLHELAYGITSDNPRFGRVVNPAAPDRIPGGSSGGSAAAIAAGIVHGALGTDTAGSIRVPAACCGIVGFKPSYDVLPRKGVLDLAPTLDHVGPMGRTVADTAALFAALLDLSAMPAWRYDSLAGRRIARLAGYFDQPLAPCLREMLAEAMETLSEAGATCSVTQIDGMNSAASIQLNTICAEASATHNALLQQNGEAIGEDVRVRLEIGNFLPGHWYLKAQKMRSRLANDVDAAFGQADFLICPTMRTAAPAIGATHVDIEGRTYPLHTAVTQLTMPFNLTGHPAISIPWSHTEDGAPLALQIIGRRSADWQVLAIAELLETLSPWTKRQTADNLERDRHAGN